MNTLLHWLGGVAVVFVLFSAIAFPIWLYESWAKKRKFEAAFTGRDPLDEQLFYQQYFQSRGVPADVVIKIRRVLEEVLGADMSRLKADDDLTRNLSFFFQYDSLADVEIVERLEEEFSIKIADAEAEQTHTVEDIVTLVWLKLRQHAA
jgi:acyl carrier protein